MALASPPYCVRASGHVASLLLSRCYAPPPLRSGQGDSALRHGCAATKGCTSNQNSSEEQIATHTEVRSTFQNRPAYRYIRRTDKLPTYAELEDKGFDETIAKVRLFNPTGAGTWWVAAYDPDSMIAWGVAELFEREVGSFSMQELVELRGGFGLPVERDLHYRPKTLAAILDGQTW